MSKQKQNVSDSSVTKFKRLKRIRNTHGFMGRRRLYISGQKALHTYAHR